MKNKNKVNLNDIDKELVDYIKKLKFKHRIFGVDEKEIWTVVSNIQKYYTRKDLELKIKYKTLLEERENEIASLRKEIGYADIQKKEK